MEKYNLTSLEITLSVFLFFCIVGICFLLFHIRTIYEAAETRKQIDRRERTDLVNKLLKKEIQNTYLVRENQELKRKKRTL